MATSYRRDSGPGVTFYDDGGAAIRRMAKIEQDGQSVSRHDCREKICEMQRREARKRELREAIEKLNRELETAVKNHYNACTPAQDAIRKIDQLEVEATLRGKILDEVSTCRRMELRDKIDHSNTTLESVAARIRPRLALLEEELNDAALDTTALNRLRADLIQRWGDPKKLQRMRGLQDVEKMLKPLENSMETLCSEIRVSLDIAREHHESTTEISAQLDRANLRLSILRRAGAGLFHEAHEILTQIKNEP